MFDQTASTPNDREILAYHVADRLGVSVRTVRWWAQTGQLPCRRDGVKIWKFRERDVEALRESRAHREDYDER